MFLGLHLQNAVRRLSRTHAHRAKHYVTKEYDLMLIRYVSGDNRDGRSTQTLARNDSSPPISKRTEQFHSSHPSLSSKPFVVEKFRQTSAHSLSDTVENSKNYTQAAGTDSGPKETTKEDSKATPYESLVESAAINAEAIWNELEKRMKSRKREGITSEERQKLSVVFSSFERRGWAADQALALYVNSKLFPMAASRFRKLFMQATTKDLKNKVLSLADNIPAVEAFLFPLFAEFCLNNFPVEIKTYRDLVNSSNMTKPHTWFPFSRAMKRKIVYHQGPTNSGKTYTALKRLREAKSGIYCGPLRLLAMEVYDSVNLDGVYCNLVTGQERKEMPFAQHTSCTIEMANLNQNYEVAVLDEIQMITDEYRGWAWTRAFLGLRAEEIHVCGDKSALSLIRNIVECTGDEFVDFEYERFKPLTIDFNSLKGDLRKVQAGDCIAAFSRKDIYLIKRAIESQTDHRCCVIYGALPPETRRLQAKLFNDPNSGYDVLVASDAVGMGLNLNIARMIFYTMHKFNGEDKALVPSSMVKQIAGRAGRRNSSFQEGVCTTFLESDIPFLVDGIRQPIRDCDSAGLFPVFEQVELFASQLPDMTFSQLLSRFVETSRVDGLYYLCKTDNMKRLATMLEKIPGLSLEDRFKFCFAPANVRDQEVLGYLLNFASHYSQGKPVLLRLPSMPTSPCNDSLLFGLESKHQVASLYMWLAQQFSMDRFPDFPHVEKRANEIATLLAESLTSVIEESGTSQRAEKHAPQRWNSRRLLGGKGQSHVLKPMGHVEKKNKIKIGQLLSNNAHKPSKLEQVVLE